MTSSVAQPSDQKVRMTAMQISEHFNVLILHCLSVFIHLDIFQCQYIST